MKKQNRLLFSFLFIMFSVFSLAACSNSSIPQNSKITLDPQSSPVSVVKEAIKFRAANDRNSFNALVVGGREFLWDNIDNCEGRFPDFSYVEGEMNYLGKIYKIVEIYDHQSENGGFAVKEIDGKWYLEDWIGSVRCTDKTTDIIQMMPIDQSASNNSSESAPSSKYLLVVLGIVILITIAVIITRKIKTSNFPIKSVNSMGSRTSNPNNINPSVIPVVNPYHISENVEAFQSKGTSTPKFCGFCGEKWVEGAEYCVRCGQHY